MPVQAQEDPTPVRASMWLGCWSETEDGQGGREGGCGGEVVCLVVVSEPDLVGAGCVVGGDGPGSAESGAAVAAGPWS
ncbi:hypothetical protein EF879_00015 [Micromonospora sp. HM5-17]|nr:hypothetical protein EF879_00015 [Micromonospora sp. HM5-17]